MNKPTRVDSRIHIDRHLLFGLVISMSYVLILCRFFPPIWETNDDVAMSMIAHGYGIAAIRSPNILFSNIFWGYFVQRIPSINGILGYSLATIGVLIVAATVILWRMLRSGSNRLLSLCVIVLLFTAPVIFPQFTINAGLLCVASILCLEIYAKNKNVATLLTGCLLAYFSFLIRQPEFFLVLIVAIPLLPWRSFFAQRIAIYALSTLIVAMAIATFADYQAYQTTDWISFNDLNPVRSAFTDFGAGNSLVQHPEILNRHNFSSNDIYLISHWFFVDPVLANPNTLRSMLQESGPLPSHDILISNAWAGLKTLFHPHLLAVEFAALLLFLLRPNWKIAICWGAFFCCAMTFGLLGRPGITRIYVPLAGLLILTPFMFAPWAGWRRHFSTILLLVAATANGIYVMNESAILNAAFLPVQEHLEALPSSPVIIWGNAFPYEIAYPVLGASSQAMRFQHYGLGTSTLAPFSVATNEAKSGRGLTDLLNQGKSIAIMANEPDIKSLEIYCAERLHKKLVELQNQKYGVYKLSFLSCALDPD